MEVLRIHGTFSNDAIAFYKQTSEAMGEKIEPDLPDALDVMDIVRTEQISKAQRVAVDLAYFAAPPADDVDEDSNELDPMMKIVAVNKPASVLSDWQADFLKRTSEPTGNTLKKRLGIASTTIRRDEDGIAWLRGFNAAGEMVDCRTLIDVKE
jgi:hypothetical protein